MSSQLSEHVTVTITADSVGQVRAGYGTALALSYTAAWTERSRIYEGLDDVSGDFAAGTPEYLMGQAYFGQSPHPPELIIGRCALKPTQIYAIGITATGVGDGYNINIVTPTTTGLASYVGLADLTIGTRATNAFTITAHGMTTGDGPYQVSNSGGALPTGLTAATNYWIIVVDVNTIEFATTKALALVPTPVAITGAGTGTNTILRSANDVVVGQLIQDFNAVSGANYTATSTGSAGSLTILVTGNAAGNWFSLQVGNYTLLSIKQTHADPGIATDLAAIQVETDDWYALMTPFNSKAYVVAAANWIETQSKIYLADVIDTDAVNVAVGSSPSDTLFTLNNTKYNRTAGSFYPSPATFFSGAWLGRVLPDDPGSETWKGKTLELVAPVNLSSTQRANLRARNANCYTTIGSEDKTWEGKVAGGSFGFIDVTRGLDWLEDDMNKGVFDALFTGEKLPFTDAGIAVVRAKMKATLKKAARMGVVDDDFDIQVPKAADVDPADKAARNLPDLKFTAVLQGAIHTVSINGVVSV